MTRFGTTSKLVAAMLGGVLVLSACSSSDDDNGNESDPSNSESTGGGSTVTLGWGQPFDSYNMTTAGANSFANGMVMSWVNGGFWQFAGEDGAVTPLEEFGTYELTSEEPLTVEYTIDENAVWSDGDPVACDDIMLWWTAQSGAFDGLFSAVGTQGVEDTAMPECEPGGKTFSLVYETPYADWETAGPGTGNNSMMPAHVVAEQAGMTSEELIEALRGDDASALEEAAAFYNEGWLISGALPDEAIIPSSGPYKITGYEEGTSVTLTANEEYWGTPPATETVVIRLIAEEEQVQALENGEIDIIAPQPTVDMVQQIEAAQGIAYEVGNQYTYEHLDFNFNSGPFSESKELREAFALCVPRQQIVENLIQPVVPDATVKNVRNLAPWDPGYEETVASSEPYLEQYGEQDIEAARAILEEEDAVGTTIRLQTLDNQRRNDTGALIEPACEEAGFEVEFSATADFFDTEGGLSQGTFDVAEFAWVGSNQMSGWNSTYRSVENCTAEGKGNNNGCYVNPELDQLLDDILVAASPEEAQSLAAEIEAILWEDLVTIPLYQYPGIAAWSESMQNVVPNPSQAGIVWNMPEWSKE